jgi:hypothetical protein
MHFLGLSLNLIIILGFSFSSIPFFLNVSLIQMNRKGIKMIKWQAYRFKEDIGKPFVLFNLLRRR